MHSKFEFDYIQYDIEAYALHIWPGMQSGNAKDYKHTTNLNIFK